MSLRDLGKPTHHARPRRRPRGRVFTGSAASRRAYERPEIRAFNRNRWRGLLSVTFAVDLLAIACALTIATLSRFGGDGLRAHAAYGRWVPLWIPVWLVGLAVAGAYDRHRIENPIEEVRILASGVTIGVAVAIAASFSVNVVLSRAWALIAWAAGLIFVMLGRRAVRKIVHALRRRGRLRRRMLIVGADLSAVRLADWVDQAPWQGMDRIGFVRVGDEPSATPDVIGSLDELGDLVVGHRIDEVLLAPSVGASGHLGTVVSQLDGVPVDVRAAPGLDGVLPSRITVHPLGDHSLLTIERAELQPLARVTKRSVDLVLGGAMLLAALPLIALCAIAVRVDSRGPVFFRQWRTGERGREFRVWKLRSMVADAESQQRVIVDLNEAGGMLFKVRHDPRVTRVGRFLRKMSLDELPQLINVVRGQMSLVGPRPPLPDEVARYDDALHRRLLVKPGITGLWQVSGRSALSFDDYVRYDLLYVQNWSLALDAYILLKTIPAVLLRRGAY